MLVDARGLKHPEPLLKLREAFRDTCSVEEDITILVDTLEEAARVKAFAGFTGSPVKMEEAEGHYRLTVSRMCNCG